MSHEPEEQTGLEAKDAEIARLRAALDRAEADRRGETEASMAEIEALRAELAAVREALANLLPKPLEWREQGEGMLVITVRKNALRNARTALQGQRRTEDDHGHE